MKKILFTLVISTATFSLVTGQFTKVGGGLAFGSGFQFNNETGAEHRSGILAASVTGIYELNLPVHFSPSFTYFLPNITKESPFAGEETKSVVSSMMFDLNGHYVFNSLDKFEFYGLAGLNITLAKIKWVQTYGTSTSKWGDNDNAIGLNLGAGAYMKMTEQLDMYGEVKYILSKYDQLMINVGLLLNIDWLKKNENPGI